VDDEDSRSLYHHKERPLVSVSHAPSPSRDEADLVDVYSLVAVFSQITDPRKRRGVRHGLATVLTLLTLATLCGAGNFRQAADRIAELPQNVLVAAGARRHAVFGFHRVPSRDTLRRVVETIDAETCDQVVCQWLTARTEPRSGIGLALDGKTARGSSPGADGQVSLFSAMRHDQAVVVTQVAVPPGTTEVTQVKRLLAGIDLTGLVITADAAHPSPDTAAYVIRRLGEYVFTVKANKPTLLAAIAERLPNPITVPAAHVESERRSGFIVRRQVWIAPAGDLDHPGASWVFRIRRETLDLDGCRISNEYVHGVTSLPTVSAALIACFVRGHWGIENKIHWVRDVLFTEDHHRAFLGGVAQTMAAIRNLTIGLIRLAGHTRIKQVLERNHGDKTALLTLLAASRPKIN
jgi:predicted transposase YbfD/YdcC